MCTNCAKTRVIIVISEIKCAHCIILTTYNEQPIIGNSQCLSGIDTLTADNFATDQPAHEWCAPQYPLLYVYVSIRRCLCPLTCLAAFKHAFPHDYTHGVIMQRIEVATVRVRCEVRRLHNSSVLSRTPMYKSPAPTPRTADSKMFRLVPHCFKFTKKTVTYADKIHFCICGETYWNTVDGDVTRRLCNDLLFMCLYSLTDSRFDKVIEKIRVRSQRRSVAAWRQCWTLCIVVLLVLLIGSLCTVMYCVHDSLFFGFARNICVSRNQEKPTLYYIMA